MPIELGSTQMETTTSLALQAVRHGHWFEGTEIPPGDVSEADAATAGTIGRQMSALGETGGPNNRSVSLSAFAPPGA